MGMSFKTVQKAYKILHELKETVLPKLDIRSWPEDMAQWSEKEQENPPELVLLGYDKKSDDGWENLLFFMKNPSQEVKDKFAEICSGIGNTPMNNTYRDNADYWIFGWF